MQKVLKQEAMALFFDWKILDSLPAKSFILAGGIDKENICKALSFSPSVLDVNSKVETNNRKNRKLIEEIILKIKSNEPNILMKKPILANLEDNLFLKQLCLPL